MVEHWEDWHIRRTDFSDARGDCFISTVFLGIDYNWCSNEHGGDALLWETRVFLENGLPIEEGPRRLSASRELALEYHATLEKELGAVSQE